MSLGLYLLRQLAVSCLVVTGTLCVVIWLVLSLRLIDFALNAGAPLSLFAAMIVSLVPTFLPMVIPIGLMVGTLFAYNRLSQESELIVMRASGLGPLSLAAPALVVVAVATAASLALTLQISPAANRELVRAQQLVREGLDTFTVREGEFTSFGDALTVYVRERGPGGQLLGLFIHDRQTPDRPATLVAASGRLVASEDAPRIVVSQGRRQEFDAATQRVSELSFERYTVEIRLPSRAAAERLPDARERPTAELLSPELRGGLDPRSASRLQTELHQRIVLPLLVPAMGLVALFALLREGHDRRGQGGRLVAATAVGIGLQVATLAILNAASRNPEIAPLAYLPSAAVVLAGVGFAALQVASRARRGHA